MVFRALNHNISIKVHGQPGEVGEFARRPVAQGQEPEQEATLVTFHVLVVQQIQRDVKVIFFKKLPLQLTRPLLKLRGPGQPGTLGGHVLQHVAQGHKLEPEATLVEACLAWVMQQMWEVAQVQ